MKIKNPDEAKTDYLKRKNTKKEEWFEMFGWCKCENVIRSGTKEQKIVAEDQKREEAKHHHQGGQ
jgi:hypothetical protein